ncbi:hypothetical protein Nepgr_017974 [Nepenthes gracilis]|uniref:Uncharacterized protein n=1 Tax=Nepenthes gracilis TaxID=150966 RepID=A0AAD3SRH9_NEPGR|nr:hypothetical protein Nepgr_017974 [Nepenthes gracilis]
MVADEVLVVAGPKLAPCPIGKDRVGKENEAPLPYPAPCTLLTPLDILHQINHYLQGGLGVDGKKPVSVLSNVDGNRASFAEFIKHGLAADSSPSPHAAPANQHGKAPGSAQLALGLRGFECGCPQVAGSSRVQISACFLGPSRQVCGQLSSAGMKLQVKLPSAAIMEASMQMLYYAAAVSLDEATWSCDC